MLQEHCCSGMWNKFSLLTMDPDLHSLYSCSPGTVALMGCSKHSPTWTPNSSICCTQRALLWNKCNNFSNSLLCAVIVSSLLCSVLFEELGTLSTPFLLFFDVLMALFSGKLVFQQSRKSHRAMLPSEVISWREIRSFALAASRALG